MENKLHQNLADGLELTTVTFDSNVAVQEVGRNPEEALAETNCKCDALFIGEKFTPRGCIYNPRRDY